MPAMDEHGQIHPHVDADVEITNIMDGTGRIIRTLKTKPVDYDNAVEAFKSYNSASPPLQFDAPQFDYQKGVYREYETSPGIAEKWYDMKLVGTCSTCGLDDAPLVRGASHTPECKWCAELANLNYHIKTVAPQIKRRKRKPDSFYWDLFSYIGLLLIAIAVLFAAWHGPL